MFGISLTWWGTWRRARLLNLFSAGVSGLIKVSFRLHLQLTDDFFFLLLLLVAVDRIMIFIVNIFDVDVLLASDFLFEIDVFTVDVVAGVRCCNWMKNNSTVKLWLVS